MKSDRRDHQARECFVFKFFLIYRDLSIRKLSHITSPPPPPERRLLGDGLPCSLLNMMQMLAILTRAGGTTTSTGGRGISGNCSVPLKGNMLVRCRLILGSSGRLTSSCRQVPVENFSFIQKDSTRLSV